MTESKNRAELKAELKAKTDKLVSQDKELFANLSKEETTEKKKERAKGFREENRELLDYLKIKEKHAHNQEKGANTEKLNEFDGKLSEENIEILIEQSRYHDINNNLEKIKIEEFNKETVEKMMLELLNDYLYRKKESYVARTNHSYNSEQIDQLNELVSYFVKNMVKIEGIDHKELVEDLIKHKAYKQLFDNLERFKGVNRKEVVEKLLEEYNSSGYNSENYDLLREIANHLEKFEGIIDHKELAERMATHYNAGALLYNLEKFKGIDHKELAEELMTRDSARYVAYYIEKFKGIDRKEIAEKIMEINAIDLLENLKKFDGVIFNFNKKQSEDLFKYALDEFILALRLFNEYGEDQDEDDDFEGRVMRHYNIILSMVDNLERFEGLNHEELAEKLIETSMADDVAEKIEKFEGVDYKKLAEKIVKSGEGAELVKNIAKFQGVTEDDIKVWFKEYQETLTKSLEFEEDTFKIDSKGWKETKRDVYGYGGKSIKVKENATGDVIEYLEGPAKGEQIFITYDAFIREVMKAKNCSKEEVEQKYLMTVDELKKKMKDKPGDSDEYKKFFNKEVKDHLAGYWIPNSKIFNNIGVRSHVWLAGGNNAYFIQNKWFRDDSNRDYGFSGRLLKN